MLRVRGSQQRRSACLLNCQSKDTRDNLNVRMSWLKVTRSAYSRFQRESTQMRTAQGQCCITHGYSFSLTVYRLDETDSRACQLGAFLIPAKECAVISQSSSWRVSVEPHYILCRSQPRFIPYKGLFSDLREKFRIIIEQNR